MGQATLRRYAAAAVMAALAPGVTACHSSSPAGLTSHPKALRFSTRVASPTPATHHPRSPSPRTPTRTPTPTRHATQPPVTRDGISRVTAADLGASWHPGCPVPASQLRAVRIGYWGFDGRRHIGVLVVNVSAVSAVRIVFARIERARFPIRRMQPVAAYGGSDNRSMDADNTSAFNCRYAVANGPKSWSEHAYGDAVDIDPRENPYRLDGRILPPSGAGYIERSSPHRGMVLAGGPVVAAFGAVGWGWGGSWSSTPDYQHFSVNGR